MTNKIEQAQAAIAAMDARPNFNTAVAAEKAALQAIRSLRVVGWQLLTPAKECWIDVEAFEAQKLISAGAKVRPIYAEDQP